MQFRRYIRCLSKLKRTMKFFKTSTPIGKRFSFGSVRFCLESFPHLQTIRRWLVYFVVPGVVMKTCHLISYLLHFSCQFHRTYSSFNYTKTAIATELLFGSTHDCLKAIISEYIHLQKPVIHVWVVKVLVS